MGPGSTLAQRQLELPWKAACGVSPPPTWRGPPAGPARGPAHRGMTRKPDSRASELEAYESGCTGGKSEARMPREAT